MPKTVIGLEVNMNASGAEGSVKSLKAQLREAQLDVSKMADKFGETSVQAANAAKKAADLKDRIGDAKALTDAFNPDKKFKAFSTALQGVVGGFTALQGAQALFGVKSEELEKTLLKVQGAMALSQGLSAITESIDGFKNLKVVALDTFKSIKAAIGSTGIGLFVIALGAIYTYWDDIKGAVNGVSEEQEKLNKKTKTNLDTEKEKLKTIGNQDNILKLQGKSEKDILKLKINQYDTVIKATEASIVQAEITQKTQVAASKRNKEILEGLLNFISLPITAILFAVDKIKNAVGQTSTLLQDYKGSLAKMVFNPEEVQTEGDKVIKEQRDALQTLKNDRAGFQLQIQSIDKEAANVNKKTQDDNAAKLKKEQDDRIAKENAQLNAQNEIGKQKEVAQIQNATNFYNTLNLLSDNYTNNEIQNSKDRIKNIEIEAEHRKAIQEATFGVLDAGAGFLKEIAGKNKAIQKVAIITENAIGIAKQVIANQTANAGALATPQAILTGGASAVPIILRNNIRTALGIATTVAATAKALSALGGGGSASGGGNLPGAGGTTAPIGTQMGGTALQQAQINATGNAAVQAFVLESDVSGNQERIERLNRAARIQ
jgi:hypothetical protein